MSSLGSLYQLVQGHREHCEHSLPPDARLQLARGKYQNCHLVLKGSFWFFLVLFLVVFGSFLGSLVLFQFLY